MLTMRISEALALAVQAYEKKYRKGTSIPYVAHPERKRAYLAHLAHASDDVLLVSGADKLHKARAIVSDLMQIGPEVFERFTASRDGTLWDYQSLAHVFLQRRASMAAMLTTKILQMEKLA